MEMQSDYTWMTSTYDREDPLGSDVPESLMRLVYYCYERQSVYFDFIETLGNRKSENAVGEA